MYFPSTFCRYFRMPEAFTSTCLNSTLYLHPSMFYKQQPKCISIIFQLTERSLFTMTPILPLRITRQNNFYKKTFVGFQQLPSPRNLYDIHNPNTYSVDSAELPSNLNCHYNSASRFMITATTPTFSFI